jgi:SAM-dependent methyltransferase
MTSPLSPLEWHQVFLRQADWTRPAREHLYRRAELVRARRVLDVGCGTGAITAEIASRTRGRVVGLDIEPSLLSVTPARPRLEFVLGDGHRLPFADGAFDLAATHFVLLWLTDPVAALREMARVTRQGGWVLACAEPDYGGRIDHPDLPIARWQMEALRREGADPRVGRRLRALFTEAGLQAEVSLISAPWDMAGLRESHDGEWDLLQRTTGGLVTAEERQAVRAADLAAVQAGTRFVFMPVFCALAQKRN